MPQLPKKKVGLISCSGEELAAGTLSRVATLRVLEQLRPNDTTTICLPLFLAGDDKERAFARFYPTITIDGCDKRCAARATEKYSATPTASIVISEFLTAHSLNIPRSRRQMDVTQDPAADALANKIARQVDEILGVRRELAAEANSEGVEASVATCSCGSGIPVMKLNIAGKEVEVVALPLIFGESHKNSKSLDEVFEAVKVYHAIPIELEPAYRDAIQRAYAGYVLSAEKPEE